MAVGEHRHDDEADAVVLAHHDFPGFPQDVLGEFLNVHSLVAPLLESPPRGLESHGMIVAKSTVKSKAAGFRPSGATAGLSPAQRMLFSKKIDYASSLCYKKFICFCVSCQKRTWAVRKTLSTSSIDTAAPSWYSIGAVERGCGHCGCRAQLIQYS